MKWGLPKAALGWLDFDFQAKSPFHRSFSSRFHFTFFVRSYSCFLSWWSYSKCDWFCICTFRISVEPNTISSSPHCKYLLAFIDENLPIGFHSQYYSYLIRILPLWLKINFILFVSFRLRESILDYWFVFTESASIFSFNRRLVVHILPCLH